MQTYPLRITTFYIKNKITSACFISEFNYIVLRVYTFKMSVHFMSLRQLGIYIWYTKYLKKIIYMYCQNNH